MPDAAASRKHQIELPGVQFPNLTAADRAARSTRFGWLYRVHHRRPAATFPTMRTALDPRDGLIDAHPHRREWASRTARFGGIPGIGTGRSVLTPESDGC
jgi:hypothetical protein